MLNRAPNSTCIFAFIEKYGRAPECKNEDDVLKISDLIRDNFIRSGETTGGNWYYYPAARQAIIDYWKDCKAAKKKA